MIVLNIKERSWPEDTRCAIVQSEKVTVWNKRLLVPRAIGRPKDTVMPCLATELHFSHSPAVSSHCGSGQFLISIVIHILIFYPESKDNVLQAGERIQPRQRCSPKPVHYDLFPSTIRLMDSTRHTRP